MILKSFCLSSSVFVLFFDVTSPRDSFARNDKGLVTLLTRIASLSRGSLDLLSIAVAFIWHPNA